MFGRDNNVLYYLLGGRYRRAHLLFNDTQPGENIQSNKSEHATNTTVVMRELDGFQIKDFNDELKMAVQNKNDYGFYCVASTIVND